MSLRPTLTLGICLAAGLAFGIGLARPGNPDATVASAPAADASAGATPASDQPADSGYGAPAEDAPAEAAPAAGGAGAATVEISGFAFSAPQAAGPGSTITVENRDGVAHTLTAEDGSFDTGSIGGGSSASLTAPTAPGTYQFFCAIHPSMTGTLTVGA